MKFRRTLKNKKGTVVIIALSMIVLFSMMASGLGFRGGLEVKLVKRNLDSFRERYLAQAAVTTVEYLVELDEKPEEDGPFDAWYGEPDWPANVDFGEGVTRNIKVTDEESKININNASEPLLTALFGLIDEENDLSTDTDELVAGIMNWRGDSAAQGGTKLGEKYKNAPFESLDELHLIKDIKPEDIPKIIPYLSVYGMGAKNQAIINPNTASPLVLKAVVLALVGDERAKKDLTDALVHYRDLLDSAENQEEKSEKDTITYFTAEDVKSPENIFLKLGMSNVDPILQSIVAQLLTYLTVDSKFYNIRVDIKENESSLGTSAEVVLGIPQLQQPGAAGPGTRIRPRRPAAHGSLQAGDLAVLSWHDGAIHVSQSG